MPKIAKAHVELESGSDFLADIANLTPSSLFLKTDRVLPFREPVTVTFFSVSVRGEAVFVSRTDPRGLVVVFDATAEVRVRLAGLMGSVEVVPSDANEFPTMPPMLLVPLEDVTDGGAATSPGMIDTVDDFEDRTTEHAEIHLEATSLKRPPLERPAQSAKRRAQDTRIDMAAVEDDPKRGR